MKVGEKRQETRDRGQGTRDKGIENRCWVLGICIKDLRVTHII